MKKTKGPTLLLVITMGLMLISVFFVLLGYGFMHIYSQTSNVFAQGERSVLCRTSEYGIKGKQDLQTDKERGLFQTILLMNDRCANMAALGYKQGHMLMVFGISLMVFTLLNGMMWWKWKKELQNRLAGTEP